MLNTFLLRHIDGRIQALDDLQIQKQAQGSPLYRINEAAPSFITAQMRRIHEAVREASSGFRSLLQGVDDEIEALQNRREDMLAAAFEDGLQLTVDELQEYIQYE